MRQLYSYQVVKYPIKDPSFGDKEQRKLEAVLNANGADGYRVLSVRDSRAPEHALILMLERKWEA